MRLNTAEEFMIRKKRITDLLCGKKPDRVPVLSTATTWILHYANIDVLKAYQEDNDLLFSAYSKFFNDVYCDSLYGTLRAMFLGPVKNLGKGTYQLTNSGLVAELGGELLYDYEYESFLANPLTYTADILLPRKFQLLEDKQKAAQAIENYLIDYKKAVKHIKKLYERIETELGTYILTENNCQISADVVCDFLRGFPGFIADMQRYPWQLDQTCIKMQDWLLENTLALNNNKTIIASMHIGSCLNLSDFKKFYLPHMKQHAKTLSERGFSVLYFMEGNWEPYIDFFEELPDGKFIALLEYGDLKTIKKKMNGKMVVAGGMPIDLLEFGTKQSCLDYAKKLIDETADGGGYIFSTDKLLIGPNDVNPENYIAVNEFVHDYAKY